MFNKDLLDYVGLCTDESSARLLAAQFDKERLFAAAGKVESTVERAFVKPIGRRNTIHGWLVLVETRSYDCVGQPWPTR